MDGRADEKKRDKMNFDSVLALGILILFTSLLAGTFLHFEPGQKCTDAELRQIIAKVDSQKKNNAGVYDHKYGENLILVVCK